MVRPKKVHDPGHHRSFTESPFFTGTLHDVFIVSDDRETGLTATLRQGRKWIYTSALMVAVISAFSLGHYLPKLSVTTASIGENFQGWIDEFYLYDHARAPEKREECDLMVL